MQIAQNNQAQRDPNKVRLTSIGETAIFTFLDNEFNPTRGSKTRFDFDIYDEYLGGQVNFWKLNLKQNFFMPIWTFRKGKTLGFSMSASVGFSAPYRGTPEVPVQKRFRVGGEDSVRGFDEDSLNPPNRDGGDSYFSFMTELNIPLFFGLDFMAFFDGGNAFASNTFGKSARDFKPWDLRYGVGPGIRVNTPVGPLKFGYGFIVDRQTVAGKREPLGNFYFGVGPI